MRDVFWIAWVTLIALALIALAVDAANLIGWPQPFHIDGST